MADEGRWVGIPILDLIERGPCRVPEKKEEVVRSLKVHGAMAKGPFDKVEREEDVEGGEGREEGREGGIVESCCEVVHAQEED